MASKKHQQRSERAEARAKKRRNQQITIATIAIAVIALILIFAFWPKNNNATDPGSDTSETGNMVTMASGLQYEDLVVGTGPAAQTGDSVSVHYTGWLEDGTKFDSSLDRGTPFDFILGTGRVIQGWDEGVAGMQVGGKRKLIIPPDLAYGPQDYGPIPGGSTLTFEIELLSIK